MSGQRCMACSRVIVHKDIKEELKKWLLKAMGQLIILTALDVYTEWKSIYIDYNGKLQRAQTDTE